MLRDEGIGADEVLRIEPSQEGSVIEQPDASDREALKAGLTVADVFLPKSKPKNGQLALSF
jgi:hypothetical protein